MADVLVFGAHPDDAEFGMGATICRLIREGKSVAICVLTRGEAGTYGTAKVREKEMRAAAKEVGAEIEILDLKDCEVFDTYENRVKLAQVIRKHKPKIVFAPYHTQTGGHKDGRAHPDHAATGKLAKSAARYAKFKGMDMPGDAWLAKRLYYYILPQELKPSFIVDVSEDMDAWARFVKCHESQHQIFEGQVLEFLKDMRRQGGMFNGFEYAEAFYSDDPIPLDIDELF